MKWKKLGTPPIFPPKSGRVRRTEIWEVSPVLHPEDLEFMGRYYERYGRALQPQGGSTVRKLGWGQILHIGNYPSIRPEDVSSLVPAADRMVDHPRVLGPLRAPWVSICMRFLCCQDRGIDRHVADSLQSRDLRIGPFSSPQEKSLSKPVLQTFLEIPDLLQRSRPRRTNAKRGDFVKSFT